MLSSKNAAAHLTSAAKIRTAREMMARTPEIVEG
jgi:hypothetical protein